MWNEVKGRGVLGASICHSITPVEAEDKMTNYPPLTSPKLNSGRFCGNKLTMPYTAMHLKIYDQLRSYGFCKLRCISTVAEEQESPQGVVSV